MNSIAPRTLPCDALQATALQTHWKPSTSIDWARSVKYEWNHESGISLIVMFEKRFCNTSSRMSWSTVWNAALRSSRTSGTTLPSSIERMKSFMTLTTADSRCCDVVGTQTASPETVCFLQHDRQIGKQRLFPQVSKQNWGSISAYRSSDRRRRVMASSTAGRQRHVCVGVGLCGKSKMAASWPEWSHVQQPPFLGFCFSDFDWQPTLRTDCSLL